MSEDPERGHRYSPVLEDMVKAASKLEPAVTGRCGVEGCRGAKLEVDVIRLHGIPVLYGASYARRPYRSGAEDAERLHAIEDRRAEEEGRRGERRGYLGPVAMPLDQPPGAQAAPSTAWRRVLTADQVAGWERANAASETWLTQIMVRCQRKHQSVLFVADVMAAIAARRPVVTSRPL